MTAAERFVFLNVERELAHPRDWNRADWPKLWLYNLHYFDDLAALGARKRLDWHRALIERWIAENPPGHGNGWEPYPTSLRIVNWVKWALAGNELSPRAVHSLAVQASWLRGRLEIHLLGNHLWANAKALVFAGAFFDGDDWRRLLGKGLTLLRRELREQVLPDGGHFERSPMYHAIFLEDLLDLLQLGMRYPSVFEARDLHEWRDTARRMLRWLRIMTHPDGEIAFFNDAAIGVAPSFAALRAYAAALNLTCDDTDFSEIEMLEDSGYARMQAGDAVLITDVGPIGPDYLPGHAHADTLSFELSLRGRRVVVNGGTSTYAADAERHRQRGTAAHNTVIVDGQDSSEVWSSFRVARRARPMDVCWGVVAGSEVSDMRSGSQVLWLSAAHDGYRRLPGRVTHRREWRLSASSLVVRDSVDGSARSVVARFRFHPEMKGIRRPGGTGHLIFHDSRDSGRTGVGNSVVEFQIEGALGVEIEPSTWHPRFGVSEPTYVVAADFTGRSSLECRIFFHESPASPSDADSVSLGQLPSRVECPSYQAS